MGTVNNHKILNRRKEVLRMTTQGLTAAVVAKQLSVSVQTIERDLMLIRKTMANKYQKSIGWERLITYNEGQRARIQRLWMLVADQKTSTRDRIRAIRELRAEEEQAIKKDQIAGILPRTTEDMMQPIVTGDNSKVQVNYVNVYQTLLQITEAEEQVRSDRKKSHKIQAEGEKSRSGNKT